MQEAGRLSGRAHRSAEALGRLWHTCWGPCLCAARRQLSVHFGPDADLLQEILARNLRSYRAVLRHSLLYTWDNEAGQPWRDVIRQSARAEFEAARHQRDPEAVARLLVTGRDYLQQVAEKFEAKRKGLLMAATTGHKPP